jgi:hypothetical protein
MCVRLTRIVPLLACLAACKDPSEASAARAGDHATWLASRAEADVRALEAALPAAAATLAARFAGPDDPRGEVTSLHDAIVHARSTTPGLDAGPSSFFAVVDAKGIVLRSDLVTDEMAGKDFFAAYPDLAKGRGSLVETLAKAPAANDEQWLAATPIGSEDELVTGFTYRTFAGRLSDALHAVLEEEARDAGKPDDLPVYYVAVFDPRGVYPAVHTPAVDEDALRAADLVAKTAGGPYVAKTTIARRLFGLGAARTPKLGESTGIAVLRSEI